MADKFHIFFFVLFKAYTLRKILEAFLVSLFIWLNLIFVHITKSQKNQEGLMSWKFSTALICHQLPWVLFFLKKKTIETEAAKSCNFIPKFDSKFIFIPLQLWELDSIYRPFLTIYQHQRKQAWGASSNFIRNQRNKFKLSKSSWLILVNYRWLIFLFNLILI